MHSNTNLPFPSSPLLQPWGCVTGRTGPRQLLHRTQPVRNTNNSSAHTDKMRKRHVAEQTSRWTSNRPWCHCFTKVCGDRDKVWAFHSLSDSSQRDWQHLDGIASHSKSLRKIRSDLTIWCQCKTSLMFLNKLELNIVLQHIEIFSYLHTHFWHYLRKISPHRFPHYFWSIIRDIECEKNPLNCM